MLYKIFVFKLTSRYNKYEVRFMNYIGKEIDDFKVKEIGRASCRERV